MVKENVVAMSDVNPKISKPIIMEEIANNIEEGEDRYGIWMIFGISKSRRRLRE